MAALKGAVNLNKGKLEAEQICLSGLVESIMRDILDDDERRVKPLGLVLLTTTAVLSSMIIYNTTFGQPQLGGAGSTVSMAVGAATHVEVPAPAEVSNTVVFKYDAAVEEVQRELLATGHFKGLVDGVNGQKTKIAIEHYQQDVGLAVTGEITPDLVNHIRYTRKVKAAADYTGSIDPAPAVAVTPVTSPVAAAPDVATAQPAPAIITSAKLKKPSQNQRILSVQKALAAKGYTVGEMNGQLSDATHSAILQFEMDNGLAMDGVVDPLLLNALGTDAGTKSASGN